MSKARPNNRRVFRNRPAIKYHSQFHNVIGSVMRNRSGWMKANDEDEKKVDFFWVETLFMHEQFDNIYFAEHVKGNRHKHFHYGYETIKFCRTSKAIVPGHSKRC